jgi:hypothetical protein
MSILVELPEEAYSRTAFAEFTSQSGFNIGTGQSDGVAVAARLRNEIAG